MELSIYILVEDSDIINGGTGFLPTSGCQSPFTSRSNSNVFNISKYKTLKELFIEEEEGAKFLTIGGAVTIQTFIEKAPDLCSTLQPLGKNFDNFEKLNDF